MSDNETVELAQEAADQIADKAAERAAALISSTEPEWAKALREENASLKALLEKPARTEIGEAGVQAKPGSADEAKFYGGDDKFTMVAAGDADVAVNLHIADVMIEAATKGRGRLSARGREVMTAAAEKALRGPVAPIPDQGKTSDGNALIKMHYALDRADARKAMTSTGSTSGDEWVPTFATSELWRDIHLATSVAASIRRYDMPTNPYDLPTETSDPTFYYASTENTAVTVSNPGTSKATLTAKKIQAEIDFSGELTEDSIIPIVPTLRSGLVRKAAQTIDDLIVHGDTETAGTGNVNTDDAGAAAGSFYLALNGMRKFCIVTNTGQAKQFTGAPTTTLYLNTRSLLGKYGARASDLRIITGFSTQNAFADVTGFKLVSEYGPNAAVVQGEVGRIYGTPVLLSEAIPGASTDKVDDDGKYTTTSVSTNDTDGWFVLTNPSQWVSGFRRGVTLESFRDIQKDMNILVCSFRMALTPSGISTAHTAYGYDITVL